MNKRVLVTGAGGLIGSEACKFYLNKGYEVLGIDNNLRKYFFGEGGDTSKNIASTLKNYPSFVNYALDIRERPAVLDFFKKNGPFDLVIHTAAQPSHDWAAKEPFTDFDVNANGTFNMLEAFRLYSPKGVFIFTSTNKVYGDNPNKVALVETETRYDYALDQKISGVSQNGIDEEMSLDHCKHSIFGASKVAADVMAQEYGKYFGLNVGVFRGGCLTGPQHSAVALHGFLAYIVDCAVNKTQYTIIGYKGKQVRDQIHSSDVIFAFDEFFKNPKQGEAYNLGGTKENSASILEVIKILKEEFNLELDWNYKDQPRIGDHICYYTDMSKFKEHYPNWKLTKNLRDIIKEIIESKREQK
ncbi:L-arabinose 1-dehydrogenase (NAD(P)(+)) [uncultured archaeon]|nr:L-arabinose 1-dehydrogenase (NAD(P)(+)) [uncultured archaeon]